MTEDEEEDSDNAVRTGAPEIWVALARDVPYSEARHAAR